MYATEMIQRVQVLKGYFAGVLCMGNVLFKKTTQLVMDSCIWKHLTSQTILSGAEWKSVSYVKDVLKMF